MYTVESVLGKLIFPSISKADKVYALALNTVPLLLIGHWGRTVVG